MASGLWRVIPALGAAGGRGRLGLLVGCLLLGFGLMAGLGVAADAAGGPMLNRVQRENLLPGTAAWRLPAAPDRERERVSGVGWCWRRLKPEDRLCHLLHLCLLSPAVPAHRLLHRRGRILDAANARC